jgi:hypothetical protein
MSLTVERLRELLDYDADTGLFRWRVQRSNVAKGAIAGTIKSDGYLQIGIDARLYLAHRLVWLYTYGAWPKDDIDHINGAITDNRLANLRDVPRLLNMQNQRRPQKNNTTGFLGVYLDKRKQKYIARLRLPGGGCARQVGQFDTPEEAGAAYVEAKRRLHAGCTI